MVVRVRSQLLNLGTVLIRKQVTDFAAIAELVDVTLH
jgi:hypothetical protein